MSDTPNPHRGEVAIRLSGRDFVMRPTYECSAEIEAITKTGLITLARRFAAGDIGLAETAGIITAGLKAAGEGAELRTVAEMVFDTGLSNPELIKSVSDLLEAALNGGRSPEPAAVELDEKKK